MRLLILHEKKDAIIKKIPNLSPEQKETLITFFNAHPNYENKIDWNNWLNLSWRDFDSLVNTRSKSAFKKSYKISGIKGLEEGNDYSICYNNDKGIVGYVPMSWEASKAIASSYIGGEEGEWCVAYQKNRSYWDEMTGDEGCIFIFFVNYVPIEERPSLGEGLDSDWTKLALKVDSENRFQVWNQDDKKLKDFRDTEIYSYGYYDLSDIIPLLNNPKAMNEVFELARKQIRERGGLDYEETVEYSYRANCFTREDYNDEETFSILYELEQWVQRGDDYETARPEEADESLLYSEIQITLVGKNYDNPESNMLRTSKDFVIDNGIGLYVKYLNGNSIRDAENYASFHLKGEYEGDTDFYGVEKELEQFLEGKEISYLILEDNLCNEGRSLIRGILPYEACSIRMLRDFLANSTIETENTDIHVYYYADQDYDYETPDNSMNLASFPIQRKNDRQLDLPYGL